MLIMNTDTIRSAMNIIIVDRGMTPLKTSDIFTALDVIAIAKGMRINGYTIVNCAEPKNGKNGYGIYAGRKGGIRPNRIKAHV